MSQQRQDGHGGNAPREGEPNEQDVTEQRVEVQGNEGQPRTDGRGTTGQGTGGFTEWLASTAVRTVLVVVGVVVVLFALGQLVGLDLLGLIAEVLSSELGRWLLIAGFGLLLIGLAQRGFRSW